MTVLGMAGPAVLLPVFGATTGSLAAAIAVLCALLGLATVNLSGVLANHLDISPRNVGEMQVTRCAPRLPREVAPPSPRGRVVCERRARVPHARAAPSLGNLDGA